MKKLTKILDGQTTYRLLLYYLMALNVIGLGWSASGKLQFGVVAQVASIAILVLTCWGLNRLFGHTFDVHTNPESPLITAFILSLIITPALTVSGLALPLAAGTLAIASKYILVIKRVHIFNPAAIGVTLTALFAGQAASWWVGGALMLPFVLVGGALLVTKLQRWAVVLTFLGLASVFTIALSASIGTLASTMVSLVVQTPLLFFAFVMVTEPLTLPGKRSAQMWYAGLIALMFPPQVHLGSFFLTPELALVVGNALAYVTSPRIRLRPRLVQRHDFGSGMSDFMFEIDRPFSYEPGQYMEWTLPHSGSDARGVRRYFTLASSPTEPVLHLGVTFPAGGSSFKRHMLSMAPRARNSPMSASQLGGDFCLPKDKTVKLAFIAGGVGITPFRSMIKYLTDCEEKRDIVLLYSEYREERLAYRKVFAAAGKSFGLRIVYFLTHELESGKEFREGQVRHEFITPAAIRDVVPDYSERMFFVAGSPSMLRTMQGFLATLGVHRTRIRTDYFPGY